MANDDYLFSCSTCVHSGYCTQLAFCSDDGCCDEYEPVNDNVVHHY